MAKVKEGDRVRVIDRELNTQDKAIHAHFEHMANLTGTVENYYGADEIAVKVDLESLPKVASDVHKAATDRMRAKFIDSTGDEARKMLSKEEIEFVPHWVILVRESDIEVI